MSKGQDALKGKNVLVPTGQKVGIHMSRTSSDGDEMHVQILTEDGKNLVRVAVLMSDVGNLITGVANTPCRVVRWVSGDKEEPKRNV